MEIQPVGTPAASNTTNPGSPSSSSSSSATSSSSYPANHPSNPNPMQSWWQSISKARSRIQSLSSILASSSSSSSSASLISSLADSDRPARSLLGSPDAYLAVSSALSLPSSGSGDAPLCQWLYETYQSSDPDLRLVVLSFVPLLSGLYLSRVIAGPTSFTGAPSLAGFEAVLLALYTAETKERAGKPILISVPDLSQPSLYHAPRGNISSARHHPSSGVQSQQLVGVLSPPLEPQNAIKSTKRASIIAVALDCYYKKISLMPGQTKVDLCEFAASWAGQDCSCCHELDQEGNLNSSSSSSSSSEVRGFSEDEEEIGNSTEEMRKLAIGGRDSSTHFSAQNGESRVSRGCRVPLPWELLQPVLRILGHCLLAPLNPQEVRDAASVSVRRIYARASHDLVPQAILASRSLIQLDNSARSATKAAAASVASNPSTPSKPKKPEILLVSK